MDTEVRFNHSDGNDRHITTRLAIIRTIEAEKRTHLAELRTGIGIITIPMSLLTILIATSQYYELESVLPFILGLSAGIIILLLVGGYLVFKAFKDMQGDHLLIKQSGINVDDIVNDYCNNHEN